MLYHNLWLKILQILLIHRVCTTLKIVKIYIQQQLVSALQQQAIIRPSYTGLDQSEGQDLVLLQNYKQGHCQQLFSDGLNWSVRYAAVYEAAIIMCLVSVREEESVLALKEQGQQSMINRSAKDSRQAEVFYAHVSSTYHRHVEFLPCYVGSCNPW
jgi:hypothetical protein